MQVLAGRQGGHVTTQFLACVAADLAAAGTRALFLVWYNARWHGSRKVRA